MTQRNNKKYFENQFIDHEEADQKAYMAACTTEVALFIPISSLTNIVVKYLDPLLPVNRYASRKELMDNEQAGLSVCCVYNPKMDQFDFSVTLKTHPYIHQEVVTRIFLPESKIFSLYEQALLDKAARDYKMPDLSIFAYSKTKKNYNCVFEIKQGDKPSSKSTRIVAESKTSPISVVEEIFAAILENPFQPRCDIFLNPGTVFSKQEVITYRNQLEKTAKQAGKTALIQILQNRQPSKKLPTDLKLAIENAPKSFLQEVGDVETRERLARMLEGEPCMLENRIGSSAFNRDEKVANLLTLPSKGYSSRPQRFHSDDILAWFDQLMTGQNSPTKTTLRVGQQYPCSGLKFTSQRNFVQHEMMSFTVPAKFAPEDKAVNFLLEVDVEDEPIQTFSLQCDLSAIPKRAVIAPGNGVLLPRNENIPALKAIQVWLNQPPITFRGACVSLPRLIHLFLQEKASRETATASVKEYQHWLAFGEMLEIIFEFSHPKRSSLIIFTHRLYFSYLASVHWVENPLFDQFRLLVNNLLNECFLILFRSKTNSLFASRIFESPWDYLHFIDLLLEPGARAGKNDHQKFYAAELEKLIEYLTEGRRYLDKPKEVRAMARLFQEQTLANNLEYRNICLKLLQLLASVKLDSSFEKEATSFAQKINARFSKSSLTTASVKKRLKADLEKSSPGDSKADAKSDASCSSSTFSAPSTLSDVASRIFQSTPNQTAFFDAKRTNSRSFDTLSSPILIANTIYREPAAARQVFIRDLFAYFDAKPAKELFEDTHAKFYFKILRAYIEMNSIEKEEQEAVIKFLDAITMRQANSPLLKGLYVSVMIMMESGDENRLRFINTLLAKRHDATQEKMCVENLRKKLCRYLPPEMMVRMVDQLDTDCTVDLLSQYATEFLATQSGLATSEAVLEIGLAVWECQAIGKGASLRLKI